MARPFQVYLDEDDLGRLEQWSRERGWTKSQAVRVAIRALTREREEDPLLAASGMIEGMPDDASERIDSYLEETFVAEKAPAYAKGRSRRRRRLRR